MLAELNSDFETHNRQAMLDHVRVVLTALVIFHHAAIVYGGSGEWYRREEANSSNQILVGFNAINRPLASLAFSIALSHWVADPLAKTLVTGLASYGGCILIASFLLWIPPVRRVL